MDIVEAIIKYRTEHNLTQTQFAELCGVSVETIWRIENGKPSYRTTEMKIRSVIE